MAEVADKRSTEVDVKVNQLTETAKKIETHLDNRVTKLEAKVHTVTQITIRSFSYRFGNVWSTNKEADKK